MIAGAELKVLSAVCGGETYGLEIVNKSNGEIKIGSVYVLLGRLESKGLIVSRKEKASENIIPRRFYCQTELGRRVNLLAKEITLLEKEVAALITGAPK